MDYSKENLDIQRQLLDESRRQIELQQEQVTLLKEIKEAQDLLKSELLYAKEKRDTRHVW